MIPNPDQLQAIAKLQRGDLSQIPFPVVLHALAVNESSVVLEIERKPLKKSIVLEKGVPVDCRSNLLHETLGRFLVSQGMITDEACQDCQTKSISHGLPLGEILILEGLISASDLYKVLQQNLAKKLLDGFTWRSGEFQVLTDLPEVDSPLKVKTPQLVVTGISKFALDEEINGAVGPLVGKKLFLHPAPAYPVTEIHLSKPQRELTKLLINGKRIDELAAETTIPFDQIMRLLYSLAILGIVVPEEWLPKDLDAAVAPAFGDTEDASAAAIAAAVANFDPVKKRDDLMEVYLKYRKQDAFDLLGLEDNANLEQIQTAFMGFSERFAPWSFAGPELKGLTEKAEDLFLAGGMAFGELSEVERRNALIQRRVHLRQAPSKAPDPERFAIKSELLDSEHQFKKGKALMKAQRYREAILQLQFAYDCDPQNSIYRAELAYCKFLDAPGIEGQNSLTELKEATRIDPKCGLAYLYTGQIQGELGEIQEAETNLQRAIKMMAPDRRPIEALKALQEQAKAKKKRSLLGR